MKKNFTLVWKEQKHILHLGLVYFFNLNVAIINKTVLQPTILFLDHQRWFT